MIRVFDIGPQGRMWFLRKDGVLVSFHPSETQAIQAAENAAQHSIPCVISVRNATGKLIKQREIIAEALDMEDEWIIIEDID